MAGIGDIRRRAHGSEAPRPKGGASGKWRYDYRVGCSSPPLQQERGGSSRLAREAHKPREPHSQAKINEVMSIVLCQQKKWSIGFLPQVLKRKD